MSYETITKCTRDTDFQDRVTAGAMKEAIAGGPEFSQSSFAQQLRRVPQAAVNWFIWPLAVDNEADYAYAIGQQNPAPGKDPSVISDAKIQAGVQHWWPAEVLSEPLSPASTVIPAASEATA